MNVDEAFAEMKKRGWGFAKFGEAYGIGPIMNPDYEIKGCYPIVQVLGMDKDQVKALEKAIANEAGSKGHG